MEVFVLGPVTVRIGAVDIAVQRPLERAALVRLALARGGAVSDGRLAADLWGDERRVERLWLVMSRLRATIGAERLVRTAAGYRITATLSDLDAVESAVPRVRAAQQAGQHAVVRAETRAALRCWRGAALAGVSAPFAAAEVRRLAELRLELTVAGLHAALELGAVHEALAELTGLAAAHPADEAVHRLLALALYRAGRQADALDRLRRLREALSSAFDAEPEAKTLELEQRMLRHDPALRVVAAVAEPALAVPVTAFLGRDDELRGLAVRLAEPGLITVTGGPGCGKSRLALEAATRAARAGRAVVLVELATVRRGDTVAQAIAMATALDGAPELPVLAAALDGALLVLDNAEHLAADVAALGAELCGTAQGLTILVTSQVPLGCAGERVHLVGALDRRTSLALFAERAGITLDAATQPDAVTICAAVDWLPLGIELAAGLTRTLSVAQLAARIEDRVRLLVGGRRDAAGGRHTSLRAALDWSYELLDPRTQSVLRRVAVFAGGFSAEAAAAVLPAEDAEQVASALAELSRRNVVTVLVDGDYRRLSLLETVRDHALTRLTAAGEADDARERHVRWCLDHVRAAEERYGFGSAQAVAAVFAEWADIRAALDTSAGTAGAVRLAIAMHRPWLMRAWYAEAGGYYERVLREARIPTEERAEALSCWSFHTMMVGRLDEAAELLDTAAELVGSYDNTLLSIGIRYYRGLIDIERARFADAIASLGTAAELAHDAGDRQSETACLDARATARLLTGDAHAAIADYRRATEIDRADGNEHGLCRGLSNQAKALLALGDPAAALAAAGESDDYARRLDDRHMLAHNEQVRAAVEVAAGRLEAAEMHCRTAQSFMDGEIGTADIDLADVLIARGQPAEAHTLLRRVYADTEPGRSTWLAARPISAALAYAEGDIELAQALARGTRAAYADTGFGWSRYVRRLADVEHALAVETPVKPN
ncbi:ATP-binding protein [Nocardia sp. NPDC052566]|uniref:ATP-binding protein n=1 Tax=Nocardia sp. NPDC052566 TaxID=3364330 RepID=UPI0037C62776